MGKKRRKTNLRLIVRNPGLFVRAYWLGLAVLTAGAVLDGWTTFRNVAQWGIDTEAHAALWIWLKMFGPHGIWLSIPARIGFVILVAIVWRPWCQFMMILCGLIYLVGAMGNYWLWW